MMDFDEFAEYVRDNIQEYLMAYDIEKIDIHRVIKTNGIPRMGLTVLLANEKISPNIYLESFFAEYERGVDIEETLEHISDAYTDMHSQMPGQEYSDLFNDDINMNRLFLRAVNYKKNKERLQDVVYEKHMDLALEVRMLFESNEDGMASTAVTFDMLERFGVSPGDALNMARQNTPMLFPAKFGTITNMLIDKGILDDGTADMIPPIWVLTNNIEMNGAAYIAYDDIIGRLLQENDIRENVYVIPSSIHELLLLPVNEKMDAETLQMMVQEINRNEVDAEDYLSDNVYSYDVREKAISQITDADRDRENEREV
ncbi:MAG: DUF5688 family protein [Clostridium sp.]|nr:DUF5688 family protein [Clostridium sp.]